MATPKTGGPRGRPPVPVRQDPERWWISFFAAQAGLGGHHGLTERQIAMTMCAARYGELESSPENIRNYIERSGHAVFVCPAHLRRGREGDASPRNGNAFLPRADDLCRKARAWGNLSLASPDGFWFVSMVGAWAIAWSAPTLEAAINESTGLCWRIGESALHTRAIVPIALSRFGRAPEPKFSLPDFFPQDAA